MKLERQSLQKDIVRSLSLEPVRNYLELLHLQKRNVLYATVVFEA
jgi:hypothetical protein